MAIPMRKVEIMRPVAATVDEIIGAHSTGRAGPMPDKGPVRSSSDSGEFNVPTFRTTLYRYHLLSFAPVS